MEKRYKLDGECRGLKESRGIKEGRGIF